MKTILHYALLASAINCAYMQGSTGSTVLTPAEVSIRKAEEEIAIKPDHYPYYNTLAMAYARRARETSDVSFYSKADETLKKSFAIAPSNFEGLKVSVWLLLGRHEFAKARELATRLNKQMPDDITIYGYLADANAELGDYKEAVNAAQWMLNLRPGNVAGLTRAAYLRELHGEIKGAVGLMQMAYDSTLYRETEDRAWLLTQIAHLHILAGDLNKAETYATGALGLFPNYHYALGVLAQIRLAQNRSDEAITLLRQRYNAAPHAENLYALAEALERAGRRPEASRAFADFERLAIRESLLADNANHELIAYYTDQAHEPAKALEIARLEIARRRDIFTLDSYAWALAANGDYTQANDQIREALATGTKESRIRRHADAIALHLQTYAE